MKRLLPALLFVALVAPATAEDKKEPKKEDVKQEVFRGLNYEKALEAAKKEKKLVMLDFTTTWCGWCKVLDRETFSNDKVQVFLKGKTVAIKVDGDKEKDLVKKYKVEGYPTLVFLGNDGKEVGRIVGYKPPDKFMKDVESFTGK